MSNLSEGIRKFRSGIIPVGQILVDRSRMSDDDQTQRALESANTVLQSEGIALLDAHRSRLDIILDAAALSQNLDIATFLAPAAAYLYYLPGLHKYFFEGLNNIPGVEVWPVFRAEEQGKTKRNLLDSSNLSAAEKHQKNLEYIARTQELIQQPHSLEVIAPYGSRHVETPRVRRGVQELLKSGAAALCSVAIFDPHALQFVVHLSELLPRFDQSTKPLEINQAVAEKFRTLPGTNR